MFLAEKCLLKKQIGNQIANLTEPLSFTTLQCKKFNALFYNNMSIIFQYSSSTMDIINYCSVFNTLLHFSDNIIVNCQNCFITNCYIL